MEDKVLKFQLNEVFEQMDRATDQWIAGGEFSLAHKTKRRGRKGPKAQHINSFGDYRKSS
jgi:hypothetical protein